MTAQLQSLKSQRSALYKQSSGATTRITADRSGVFSSLVDGYESLLTPETVFQLTPSSLAAMMDSQSADEGAVGKLITSDRWYFAASLPNEGGTALLRFTGDFSQDVDMQVEQVGPTEGEVTLVVFSSDRYLARTTLLRHQTAELIFESFSGLRVPKEAVRMIKSTQKDEETGEEREVSKLGVYVLVAGRAEFKGIQVVTEGGDYYVVKPTSTSSDALRAGDEVITQAIGLFDGQLLQF